MPHLVYKHDWTHRNAQLVDAIRQLVPPTGAKSTVLVRNSNWWDAAMLILYANYIRNADIEFWCSNRTHKVWKIYKDICPPIKEKSQPMATVELGSLYGERTAKLFIAETEVWNYVAFWQKIAPEFLRKILKPHYNL